MGTEMLHVAARHPGFVVLRACDIDEIALARLRQAHPEVTFSMHVQDLIEASDLDATYVAVPPAAVMSLAGKRRVGAQDHWRMVNAPHLVALVRAGATFINGKLADRPREQAQPAAA